MAAEHATTGDAINHAVDKVSDAIGHLASGAPKVMQVTLATVQADAVANVIYGAEALAVIAVALLVWVKWYWPWLKKADDYDMELPAFFMGLGLVAVVVVFGFVAICSIFDPWTYIAMQHPDMYLAHKLMTEVAK